MRYVWLLAVEPELELLQQRVADACAGLGCFPSLRSFSHVETLEIVSMKERPDCVLVSLPGVAGLNAVEYLRRLCPECGLIWASDLDFSLQAYRLRADQFILGSADGIELAEGLSRCLQRQKQWG